MIGPKLGKLEKYELNFFQKTPKSVLLITQQPEAVLYSKQLAGYPLSPHIKTIDVAFLRAE